ncbi:MAG: AmmeMemoRadiSam system protein A [Bacteroidales bacterium]|nr:AmmeMemoRadiSam system protein A [Bacteroidales bacterium]
MTYHFSLTELEKKQLLLLSRNAIRFCFERAGIQPRGSGANLSLSFCEKKLYERYSGLGIPVLEQNLTCFVSLYALQENSRQLRGCIGTLEAQSGETLLEDLISNSIHAAFKDSRFEPLEEKELATTLIEISILSEPQPIEFENMEELFRLIKGKGVVLKSGIYRATYLPQVWEQVSKPEDFLMHLARKAGIRPENYLNASYSIYEVYSFEDKK